MTADYDGGEQRLETILYAMLALQIEERERRLSGKDPDRKIELLLSESGFNARDIATLLGKNYEAVRKAITRARSTTNRGD